LPNNNRPITTQANRSGNQAQPIVHDGVIYTMTGENDAFAISVESGAVLWEYKANIDPKIARPCCSWVVCGVALGDGKVFVGRNDGRLTVLDTRDGKKLWELQTDGGVNARASTFEYKGKQYVVVLAGGTALAGSKRNDGLWLFSLEGKTKSLPRGSADPVSAPHGVSNTVPTTSGNVAKGKELFMGACVVCHGDNGKSGTHGGAPLTTSLTLEAIVQVVTMGRNQMPAFGSALSAQDREDLAAYVLQLVAR
jgi:quinohemoprotein ethanol dehydrogenase